MAAVVSTAERVARMRNTVECRMIEVRRAMVAGDDRRAAELLDEARDQLSEIIWLQASDPLVGAA